MLAQPSRDDNSGEDRDIIAHDGLQFSYRHHYGATVKECCAVVWAFVHWRPYVWDRHLHAIPTAKHSSMSALYVGYVEHTSDMGHCSSKYDLTVKRIRRKYMFCRRIPYFASYVQQSRRGTVFHRRPSVVTSWTVSGSIRPPRENMIHLLRIYTR